jgi:hypothetical protein
VSQVRTDKFFGIDCTIRSGIQSSGIRDTSAHVSTRAIVARIPTVVPGPRESVSSCGGGCASNSVSVSSEAAEVELQPWKAEQPERPEPLEAG